MKKILFYTSFLLFFSNGIFAQLDSLILQLESSKKWKDKINAHQDLARYYTRSDTAQVIKHANAMLEIATQEDDILGYCQYHATLSSFYMHTSKYDLAEKELKKGYELTLQLDDPERISSILGNIGVLKYYKNEVDSALYYLDTAYQIKKTLPGVDSSNLATNLNSLAIVSKKLSLYEDAIKYQMEAVSIADAMQDNSMYIITLSALASLYDDMGEPEKAFRNHKIVHEKAIENQDLQSAGVSARNLGLYYEDKEISDSAYHYFVIAYDYFTELGYIRGLAEANISLGDWHYEKQNYDRSIPYFEKAISSAKEIEDDRLLANASKNLGLVYLEKNDFPKAYELINRGLEIYKELDDSFGLPKSYQVLSEYYEKTGDWENAFVNSSKYHVLKDSLNELKLNGEVKKIQVQYETELKDAEIKKQGLIIQNQKSERRFLYSLFLSILGLSLMAALAFFYRNRKNKVLASQNLKLKTAKIEQLVKERKIMAMSSMIDGQESERARIAKDLHDGLGGMLSSVSHRLSHLDKQVQQIENYGAYERTTQIVGEACEEVRRISYNLMPGNLSLEGLGAAVKSLAQELSEVHGIDILTEIVGFENMKDETRSIYIYRIIQEATNNIIKYANASKVQIQLLENEDMLKVMIKDNGIGFDSSKEYMGLGLRSMTSRVEYFKGDIDIQSVIGGGTTIIIYLPKDF